MHVTVARAWLWQRVAMRDSWIVYATFGVLVCLLVWRVATQRNAGNLRASLIILGVAALTMVARMSAFDPKRTSGGRNCCNAQRSSML